jgi:opacity protein-like surface antigen
MKRIILAAVLLLALAPCASAQMVGATNRQSGGFISSDPSPLYRPTGPSIRFSIGASPLVSVAYNHQLTPWFMVGGGVGLCFVNGTMYREDYHASGSSGSYYWNYSGTEVYSLREKGGIPIFVEAEVRTPRYKWSFFVDTKLGYILNAPEDRIERGTDRSPYFSGQTTCNDKYEWNRILFSLTAGASYKNVSLGIGYAYTEGFNLQLSYNLPISVITSHLL